MRLRIPKSGMGVLLAATAALLASAGTAAGGPTGGFDPSQVLTLGNEYVVLGVTRTGPEAGRFALETTGGSPERSADDGKPLIYGRPRPWTSYTTVRLDGQNFVFGGPSETRAGRGGKYGTVVQEPAVRQGGVEATCLLDGMVEVRQVLELAKSSTSGLEDTVRIVYEVTNRDSQAHRVGLRIMLDTMLGSNDGAPIRLGERTLTGDAAVEGSELPPFWQAFDSLGTPSVMAQGTVADATTVRPDRVLVTNWGNLADHLWDAPLTPGREFIREGEEELDSAIALYWYEKPLEPGETRLYATAYGLGGVTIIPGELTLGITSPATVGQNVDGTGTFSVLAYVQNVGKWPARDTRVKLRLPDGMTLAAGEDAERFLGDLAPGAEASVLWHVQFRGLAGSVARFRVEAVAAGLSPVSGERSVTIQGPPQLAVEALPVPAIKAVGDGFSPERLTLEVRVANRGAAPAHLVKAGIALSPGWRLAPFEKREKFLGTLEPQAGRGVSWVVVPDPEGAQEAKADATVSAANALPAKAEFHAQVPALRPRLYPAAANPSLSVGSFFRVEVRLANVDVVNGAEFDLAFDPGKLAVVGVTPGEALVTADRKVGGWSVERVDNAQGLVGRVRLRLGAVPEGGAPRCGTLLTLHLLAKAPGEAVVAVRDAVVYSARQDQRVELGVLRLAIVERR
ncbi:MAG TPA: hypothetical protein GXX28_08780 [Firmicutes bacterium]|nr:hypothetical protein [Bacillota bacterium]